jgi:4-hydroxy-3-polyprenylbenzoate decarboxylase
MAEARTVSTPSLLVAITGASGAAYGLRVLERAIKRFGSVGLTISEQGAQLIAQELNRPVDLRGDAATALLGRVAPEVSYYHQSDLSAPFATGSQTWPAMVIVPCSMGTVGRIAAGVSDDLITRAADVALKEKRKLVLVPRETPLSTIHLRNLLTLSEAGAVILPAMPAFYQGPQSVEDLVGFVVERIFACLGEAA